MATTIIIAKNSDAEKAMAVLTAMGITFTTTEETAKATTKAKTTKAQPKAEEKSENKFNRAKYESISREFGCWSERKSTCYKKCRDTVYKVMNGELTKAKAKAEVKKILATEYGIK